MFTATLGRGAGMGTRGPGQLGSPAQGEQLCSGRDEPCARDPRPGDQAALVRGGDTARRDRPRRLGSWEITS